MTQGSSPLARYGAVAVTTCSPGQLLVMLYDGLFRFLGEAKAAMIKHDRARAGERIGRAHAILEQLLMALDPTHAPELCANLGRLYPYCMERIIEANIRQDIGMINEVMQVMEPIREAWKIAVTQVAVQAVEAKGSGVRPSSVP